MLVTLTDASSAERTEGTHRTDSADQIDSADCTPAVPGVLIAWKMLAKPVELDVLMVSKKLESTIPEPGVAGDLVQ
ncbi:unnamed protein product [Caretta caretta]